MPVAGSFSGRAQRQLLIIITPLLMELCAVVYADSRQTGEDVLKQRSGPGLCAFGPSVSCCYGWRNVNGHCQPLCTKPCLNGACVGPDTCECHEGYEGKWCDEDINECGLPKRPCSHRCMNTAGSFRCYCDPGYTLESDGSTCTKESECWAARCQFGCQTERGGGMHCLCPPGLQLAPDNRTCKDIDECQGSVAVCSAHQSCKNTFGSFVCVCSEGFVLGILQNSLTCRDKDECLTSSHRCSRRAICVNTQGSYRCQCEEDYAGDGFVCKRRKSGRPLASKYFQYKLSKRTSIS